MTGLVKILVWPLVTAGLALAFVAGYCFRAGEDNSFSQENRTDNGVAVDPSREIHVFRQYNQPHHVLRPFAIGDTLLPVETLSEGPASPRDNPWVITFAGPDGVRVQIACEEVHINSCH